MTVPHSLVEGKKITYDSLPLSLFKMRSIDGAYRTRGTEYRWEGKTPTEPEILLIDTA